MTKYTASLEIKQLTGEGTETGEVTEAVSYKPDGNRFKTSESTLKMIIDSLYEFRVNIRPTTPLHSVRVHSHPVTIVDLSGPDSVYAFKWATTGFTPSKRGKREVIDLSLQFQGNLALMLPLQVKMYVDSDHLTPTTPLHHIEYECKQSPGSNQLEICAIHFHRQPPHFSR